MSVLVLAKRGLSTPITIEEGANTLASGGLIGFKGGLSFRVKCSNTVLGFTHVYLCHAGNSLAAHRNSLDIKWLVEESMFEDGKPLISADH